MSFGFLFVLSLFTLERMADHIEAVYQEVVNG